MKANILIIMKAPSTCLYGDDGDACDDEDEDEEKL